MSRVCRSDNDNAVSQPTDAADLYLDEIFCLERKVIRRYDTRSGKQDGAMAKNLTAEEEIGQLLKASFDLAYGSFPGECFLPIAKDF